MEAGQNMKILGSESFTRWLIWGPSAGTRDNASARNLELGKIRKFLHPTTCKGIKFNFFTIQ